MSNSKRAKKRASTSSMLAAAISPAQLQDSNVIDEDDEMDWYRHLNRNSDVLSLSKVTNIRESTTAELNSDSRIVDNRESDKWYEHLQTTNQDLSSQVAVNNKFKLSSAKDDMLIESTTSESDGETREIRKKRGILRKSRKSTSKDVFSQVLDASRSSKRIPSLEQMCQSLDRFPLEPTNQVSEKFLQKQLSEENDTSTDSDKLKKKRPFIFKNPPAVRKSYVDFDNVLNGDNSVIDSPQNIVDRRDKIKPRKTFLQRSDESSLITGNESLNQNQAHHSSITSPRITTQNSTSINEINSKRSRSLTSQSSTSSISEELKIRPTHSWPSETNQNSFINISGHEKIITDSQNSSLADDITRDWKSNTSVQSLHENNINSPKAWASEQLNSKNSSKRNKKFALQDNYLKQQQNQDQYYDSVFEASNSEPVKNPLEISTTKKRKRRTTVNDATEIEDQASQSIVHNWSKNKISSSKTSTQNNRRTTATTTLNVDKTVEIMNASGSDFQEIANPQASNSSTGNNNYLERQISYGQSPQTINGEKSIAADNGTNHMHKLSISRPINTMNQSADISQENRSGPQQLINSSTTEPCVYQNSEKSESNNTIKQHSRTTLNISSRPLQRGKLSRQLSVEETDDNNDDDELSGKQSPTKKNNTRMINMTRPSQPSKRASMEISNTCSVLEGMSMTSSVNNQENNPRVSSSKNDNSLSVENGTDQRETFESPSLGRKTGTIHLSRNQTSMISFLKHQTRRDPPPQSQAPIVDPNSDLCRKLREMKKKRDEEIQSRLKELEKQSPVESKLFVNQKRRVTSAVHSGKKNASTKVVDKAYIVNGQVYKQPKLPRPKHWATDRLYQFLWKKLEPKYGIRTRVRSETFVTELAAIVGLIMRRKKYSNYSDELEELMRKMAHLGIIKTPNDFYHFCYEFLPYAFRVKVTPMLHPGNEHIVPSNPDKLNQPILLDQK